MKIEIWSDIVCSFCYIGGTQFRSALSAFEHKDKVEVVHRSFQLQPDAPKKPTGKKAYEDLAREKNEPVDAMKAGFSQIAAAGKQEGLEMNMLDTVLVNTFDAHRLIHFADANGKQSEVTSALFQAYFSKNENIAERSVLLSVAEAIGLNRDKAQQMLDSNAYVDEVKADIQKAASLGIRGVPFFVADGKIGTSGARGVDGFGAFLQQTWHETHPIKMTGDGAAMTCTDETC